MPPVKYLFVLTSSPKDFFCEQTLVAIASLRVHNPGAFVTLLTDDKTAATLQASVLRSRMPSMNSLHWNSMKSLPRCSAPVI